MITKSLKETISTLPTKESSKQSIIYSLENFGKIKNNKIILKGAKGTGKTRLIKKIIENTNTEHLYYGTLNYKKIKRYNDLEKLLKDIKPNKKQIIILENTDLLFFFRFESTHTPLMQIKNINSKIYEDKNKLLIISNRDGMLYHETIEGGIIEEIELEEPNKKQRLQFLKNKIIETELEQTANKTTGYTYQELEHITTIINQEKQTKENIKKALTKYKPQLLREYDVDQTYNLTLKNLIGRDKVKTKLLKIIKSYNQEKNTKFNIKRTNCLLFTGKPGTGKSYMVKALSGELEYPILNLTATRIQENPFHELTKAINISKKLSNLIIFIDEAEKLFGKEIMQSDTALIGEFNKLIDGIGTKTKAIIILNANDANRLGEPLRDRFLEIEFELPNEKEREELFKKLLKENKEIQLNPQELARNTKNQSFRQIEMQWDNIILEYLENPQITPEELIKINQKQPKSVMYGWKWI